MTFTFDYPARMQDRNKGGEAGTDPCSLAPLGDLIDRLRVDCPWDRELSLADLRAYLIEEAHELAAAIDERDPAAIEEELGDLLFEAVYVARLAGAELADVPLGGAIRTVIDKMVARHPHVFGDEEERKRVGSAAEVAAMWERRKRRADAGRSVLDGVPASLPALVGAYRLGQKAAGVGFDWESPDAVRAKVAEELGELDRETAARSAARPAAEAGARIEEELGDLLFAVANLARHLRIDPERALAAANRKFRRRFAAVEAELEPGPDDESGGDRMERMERLWERAKRTEAAAPGATAAPVPPELPG